MLPYGLPVPFLWGGRIYQEGAFAPPPLNALLLNMSCTPPTLLLLHVPHCVIMIITQMPTPHSLQRQVITTATLIWPLLLMPQQYGIGNWSNCHPNQVGGATNQINGHCRRTGTLFPVKIHPPTTKSKANHLQAVLAAILLTVTKR